MFRTIWLSTALLFTLWGTHAYAEPAASAVPAQDGLRQIAGILDYVAGDYRAAVAPDGTVTNPPEYAEQQALAHDASALARQAGLTPQDSLTAALADLERALEERRSAVDVLALCRAAREIIVLQHHIDLSPKSAPSRELAMRLWTTQGCNTCHGEDGGARTPTAATLDPKPANFLDPARVATVSAHRAFHAITFGVAGTGMQAFARLTDHERWSLAFYVLSLRHTHADTEAGRRQLERAHNPAPTDAAGLSSLTEEELEAKLTTITDSAARDRALAYLRAVAPFVVEQRMTLAGAYQKLDEGLRAYTGGQREQARKLFISAYLDGVEPHEATLRARDAGLVAQLETSMLKLRTLAAGEADAQQLTAAVRDARALLDRARATDSDASTALIGALTITLREGVEIVLLIAALLGLVRKRGHPELARFVHFGWLLSIPAGLATFVAAESVLSGMQRELAEGLASLLAALVLLGVTHWLLGQLSAKRWVGFLARRMGSATSGRRAALGVMSLAFLAAYREAFEIVLFFQALVLDSVGKVHEVWLGAGLGMVLLCASALLLLRLGQRLRPAPFMLASSVCLALLAFILVGKGIRALQAATWLPATHVSLPDLPALGVYATVEGLIAQLVLLSLLILSAWLPARARAAERAAMAAAE